MPAALPGADQVATRLPSQSRLAPWHAATRDVLRENFSESRRSLWSTAAASRANEGRALRCHPGRGQGPLVLVMGKDAFLIRGIASRNPGKTKAVLLTGLRMLSGATARLFGKGGPRKC